MNRSGRINKLLAFLFSFAVSTLIAVVVFGLSFFIACEISPPYVTDEQTGERHGVMPMGQAFLSFFFSVLTGIVAWVLLFKMIRRKLFP